MQLDGVREEAIINNLVVVGLEFEIALRVVTDRAALWGRLADDDMATVAALPDAVSVAREDDLVVDILEKLTVALLVLTLNLGDATHLSCDVVEALLVGLACHTLVHVGPLEVLALGSVEEVVGSLRHRATMEVLEPHLGMLLLVGGSLLEDSGDLLVAVLLSA